MDFYFLVTVMFKLILTQLVETLLERKSYWCDVYDVKTKKHIIHSLFNAIF